MITKVSQTLAELGVQQGSRIAVAFSGGCDSSALLHTILTLAKDNDYSVCAIHINHCLRGEESDNDEKFAKSVCNKYGVELYAYSVNVADECAKSGESTELCARRLRYTVFDAFIEKGWYVATAHTASDNAETVLFNLTRGTGVTGMCGIPHKRGNYIRPLISCTREDVEDYCKLNKLDYVTDSTNLTDDYTRNFIRHNVVPKLKDINPSFESTVFELTNQMRQVDTMLDRMARELLSVSRCKGGYDCSKLLKQDMPVLSKAVRIAVFEATGKHLDSKKTYEVCNVIKGGKVQLFDGWFAAGGKTLRFYKEVNDFVQSHPVCEGLVEFENFSYKIEFKTQPVNNLLMQYAIDCDKIVGDAVIRCRKAGDAIKLKSRPNKQVRKLMNELQIPDAYRDAFPLICDEKGVLFISGAGVAERVLPDDKTKKMIIITCEGDNNA